MSRLIENFINGNVQDAKRQAKRFAAWRIRDAFVDRGYSLNRATLTVDFLKGRDCWQAACDAE